MKLLLYITVIITTVFAKSVQFTNNESYNEENETIYSTPMTSSSNEFFSDNITTENILTTALDEIKYSNLTLSDTISPGTKSYSATPISTSESTTETQTTNVYSSHSEEQLSAAKYDEFRTSDESNTSDLEETTTLESSTSIDTITSSLGPDTSTSPEPETTTFTTTTGPEPETTTFTTTTGPEPETTTFTTTTSPEPETTTFTTTTTTESVCFNVDESVQNLKITPSKDSLYVQWDSPVPGCNFQYKIKWMEKEKVTADTSYLINKLESCNTYDVTVTIMNEDKPLGSKSNESTTSKAIDDIQDLRLITSENDIALTWNPPNTTEKCVEFYYIEIFQDNKIILKTTTKDMRLDIWNPDKCVTHRYVIHAAINSTFYSKGIPALYRNYEVNDPPVYNGINEDDDFVITKWHFGKTICSPEIFYVIYWKTDDENKYTIKGSIDLDKNELTATITNIQPYTKYKFCGMLHNQEGNSTLTKENEILTKPKAPDSPTSLTVKEDTDQNTMYIEWTPPKSWNGEKENYNLTVKYLEPKYHIPDGCIIDVPNPVITEILLANETNLEITPVEYKTEYQISLWAQSKGGWSEPKTIMHTTKEGVPEEPRNIDFKIVSVINETYYSAKLDMTWKTPCKVNGLLNAYLINLQGSRIHDGNQYFSYSIPAEKYDDYVYVIENLKPEYDYTAIIAAKTGNIVGMNATIYFSTPAGIPHEPSSNNLSIKNDDMLVPDPARMAQISFTTDLFDTSMGNIIFYAIIVAQNGCEEKSKSGMYTLDKWPELSQNSACTNETMAYYATSKEWNPFKTYKKATDIKYILGNETCINSMSKDFCNRPLEPDTNYIVKIRGFTENGFVDTKLAYFSTEKDNEDNINIGLIVGLVVGILAIAFIIAAALFYTNGKINFKKWPRMENASQISPAPIPVPIKKFESHYKKMTENPGKIKNEFQLLSTISSDVTLSNKTALLPINKKKNRYINILPYDQTRVKLIDTATTSSDYINASFIQGYSASIEYIATQGPTEATCPSFWQMMLEQNVKLIVMLTQLVETGKEKCYKYFPDLKEEYELLNDIKIQCVEEQLLPVYNRRTFKIIKDTVEKKITHVQFNLWPDFGVPSDVVHMIEFCETIKEIKMKKPSIIVMHCSAGVGRTGTLIAMDILLQTIRDKRKVDIFGTVLNLRKQRMNMVQSERQYEFLYKCVHYVITKQESNRPSQQLSQISESNML